MVTRTPEQINEEFRLFMVRHMQFMNLWTVYRDFLSKRYIPSVPGYQDTGNADWRTPASFDATLMFVLYSFFYSLVDQHEKGINAFRIWRAKFPAEEKAIAALEYRINPVIPDLKTFRHRLGFHGSQTFNQQDAGFKLFGTNSGGKMLNLMKQYKSLNAALCELDMARVANDTEKIADARQKIDAVTARCDKNSTADFDSSDLEPLGV